MNNTLVQTLLLGMALTAGAAMAQTVPLTQDAYVVPGSGTNYGAAATMNVGGPAGDQALVQFDLTGLPAGTTGSNVAKATLTLFVNKIGAAGTVNVSVANGPWSELAVSGTGAPPVPAAAVASAVSVATAGDYLWVDATAAVQAWLNRVTSNNGLIVTPADGVVNVGFDSKESTTTSHPATLTVLLQSPGTAGVAGPVGLPGATGAVGPAGPNGLIGAAGPAGTIAAPTPASVCGALFGFVADPRLQYLTCETTWGFAKIMFITDSNHTGNLGGVAGANLICAQEASAAGLHGTFLAWISDGTSSPSTTFVKTTQPYVRADAVGTSIASSWASLTSGSLINSVALDAGGNNQGSPTLWTGVETDGTPAAANCNGWTSTSGSGTMGLNSVGSAWTAAPGTQSCSVAARLYCVQQ